MGFPVGQTFGSRQASLFKNRIATYLQNSWAEMPLGGIHLEVTNMAGFAAPQRLIDLVSR